MFEELEELKNELISYITLSSLSEEEFKKSDIKGKIGNCFDWNGEEMVSLYKHSKVEIVFNIKFQNKEIWLKFYDIFVRLKQKLVQRQNLFISANDNNWNGGNLYSIYVEMRIMKKRDATRYLTSILETS